MERKRIGKGEEKKRKEKNRRTRDG